MMTLKQEMARRHEKTARLNLRIVEEDIKAWCGCNPNAPTLPRFWTMARRDAKVLAGIAMENVRR